MEMLPEVMLPALMRKRKALNATPVDPPQVPNTVLATPVLI